MKIIRKGSEMICHPVPAQLAIQSACNERHEGRIEQGGSRASLFDPPGRRYVCHMALNLNAINTSFKPMQHQPRRCFLDSSFKESLHESTSRDQVKCGT